MSLDGHWCKLTGRRRHTTLMILVYLEFPLPLPLQTWNDCDGNCCIILSFWGYGERKSSFVLSLLFFRLACHVLRLWLSGPFGGQAAEAGNCSAEICVPDLSVTVPTPPANHNCNTPSAFSDTHKHTHTHSDLSHKEGCVPVYVCVCVCRN